MANLRVMKNKSSDSSATVSDYKKLINELIGQKPDPGKLRPLFSKCNLEFVEDPIAQMSVVLDGLNKFQSKGTL